MTGCIETDVMTLRDQAADFERRLRKLEGDAAPANWREPKVGDVWRLDDGAEFRVTGPKYNNSYPVACERSAYHGRYHFGGSSTWAVIADNDRWTLIRPAPQPDEAARLRALDEAVDHEADMGRKLTASRQANRKLRAALERVREWQNAYPFENHRMQRLDAILKDGGV